MYNLNKNGIITGSFNSFCLICDCYLESESYAIDHVSTSSHQKKLHESEYAAKFKDDHIWKFKWGYFCEFCNALMPIASKVSLHIAEQHHCNNKYNRLLKLNGKGVIAFNNTYIGEDAWQGITEEICSICNIEFDDKNQHINEAKHGLNLVLKPIKFGANNGVYRQIDDSAIQCLTCNVLITPETLNEHLNDEEHLTPYSQCDIEDKVLDINLDKQPIKEENHESISPSCTQKSTTRPKYNEKNEANNEDTTKDILESLSMYQRNSININLESSMAYCKKCLIDIDFHPDNIESHIKEHSNTPRVQSELLYPKVMQKDINKVNVNDRLQSTTGEKCAKPNDVKNELIKMLPEIQKVGDNEVDKPTDIEDSDSDSSESLISLRYQQCGASTPSDEKEIFAKANNITYKIGKNNAFCRTCQVKLPSLFSAMKQHVVGAPHKRKLEQSAKAKEQAERCYLNKIPVGVFVESVMSIESAESVDIVINDKYCITQDSFLLVNNGRSKRRCMLCMVNLPIHMELRDHGHSFTHGLAMKTISVVTSKESEFIREIHRDVFHCGFCHLVIKEWKNMEDHLKCSEHNRNKLLRAFVLQSHLPDIRQYRMRREMMEVLQFAHIMSMLNGFPGMYD